MVLTCGCHSSMVTRSVATKVNNKIAGHVHVQSHHFLIYRLCSSSNNTLSLKTPTGFVCLPFPALFIHNLQMQ